MRMKGCAKTFSDDFKKKLDNDKTLYFWKYNEKQFETLYIFRLYII